MREPKDSPWKISEPTSFRFWMKKNMSPMGYDKALKKKKMLAYAYFFSSLITLNLVGYDIYKRRKEMSSVEPENQIMQDYLASTPPLSGDEKRVAYVYNYENLKFKSMEHIDSKEVEKKRLE